MSKQQTTYCLLCDKSFMNVKNFKRHQNYLHRLCDPSPYICTYCNCGFEDYQSYENHTKAALKKSFSRKTKKRQPKKMPDSDATKIEPASSPPPLIVYEPLG